MKAVRSMNGSPAVVDIDEPPGWGGELLEITATSVCSSDQMYIDLGSQRILGHELAGLREDGTPVIVEAMYSCMACELCRRGDYNLCPTMSERALGIGGDGGMVEQFRAPAEWLVPVPDGLDVRDASIVEPATVSWHALRLGNAGPDKRVAVVGAGGLGLLAVAGARRMGAEEVALEARHPHQWEAGERLGAKIGADGKYDVVIEAAGSPSGLARAAELVAPHGVVSVLGVHLGTVEVPWMALFEREAHLVPSRGYSSPEGSREMEEAAAMLADDPEIARTIITHRFPIEDGVEAFRVAADKSTGAIRVVIEP